MFAPVLSSLSSARRQRGDQGKNLDDMKSTMAAIDHEPHGMPSTRLAV